jgi:hypothetical protein
LTEGNASGPGTRSKEDVCVPSSSRGWTFISHTHLDQPVPSNNYVGGYALPAFGSSASAGILVYVSGTSNGLSVSERASGIQGVWVHPFAR